MNTARQKALGIADKWKGENWKAGLLYALVHIGDAVYYVADSIRVRGV